MAKFYITTAIDYVNGKPHIGHALEKLQADVYARYHRQREDEVWYLTGTDEHGAKVVRAAEKAGKSPEDFANENSAKFQALRKELNLSFNDFIRTTDRKRHWPGAQLIWKKLMESGDIYKKKYRGLYCVGHEAFVTEKDLLDGKCRDHNAEPEVIEEENYFFKLSKYSNAIGEKIKSGEFEILPEGKRNEILALIERGLEDVSFSRPAKDLSWGVPVPGDEEHTMYVWCDALTNYISAIGYGSSNFQLPTSNFNKWWPADVQVIGKDILRFHAAIWPGMLLSAGLPLPKRLLVHGFVNVEGAKMSKTVGNVLDPAELVKKYGIDPIRYFLLKEIPSYEDGDFSDEKFRQVYNGELANGLGNFSARILSLASRFGKWDVSSFELDSDVDGKINETRSRVDEKLNEFKIHEAIIAINELISFGDKYINDNEIWKDTESKEGKVFNAVIILDNVASLYQPFLPETSWNIAKNIEWPDKKTLEVKRGEVLFPRIK